MYCISYHRAALWNDSLACYVLFCPKAIVLPSSLTESFQESSGSVLDQPARCKQARCCNCLCHAAWIGHWCFGINVH